MKKFRVEFNESGFYQGAGIWEVLDETAEVTAESAQQAIECVVDYLLEDDENANEYAYRASEIINGEYDYNNWKFRD